MIPFSYNNDNDNDDIDADLEDIIDNIFMDSSTSSTLVFNMDIERPYEHYHMITDMIAIGDYTTPYQPFDVIFNFNYPYNGALLGVIDSELDYESGIIKKTVHKIGLLDTTIYSDTLIEIFIKLIPYLIEAKGKRILFHCYAGISRSTTAAILYLMLTTKLTLQEIYALIESKRFHVNPNPTFRRIIDICYSMRSQIK